MSTVFRSSYATMSLLGQINEFHGVADLIYDFHKETTINTKRGVYPDETPANPAPLLKYFGIGINGYHNMDDGTLSQPYYPLSTDMDLYEPLPFRCFPLSELGVNIDPATLTNYRMMTIVDIGGVPYVQYWLKMLDFQNQHVQLTKVDPDGTESAYVLDPSNLNPTPDPLSTPDVEDGTSSVVVVSIESACVVTGEEVVESINALYAGDLRRAKISEIGFYTGEDKNDATYNDINGTAQTYTEAIYAQMAAKRTTNGDTMSDTSAVLREDIQLKSGNISIL